MPLDVTHAPLEDDTQPDVSHSSLEDNTLSDVSCFEIANYLWLENYFPGDWLKGRFKSVLHCECLLKLQFNIAYNCPYSGDDEKLESVLKNIWRVPSFRQLLFECSLNPLVNLRLSAAGLINLKV